MNLKLIITALVFVALMGCQAAPGAARPNPTERPNVSLGDGRTVVARPAGTQEPAATLPGGIVIEQDPGVTGAAPTNTRSANQPPQATPVGPGAGETPPSPDQEPTPLPTQDIVRPLLPTPGPGGSGQPQQGAIGTPIDLGGAAITVTGTSSSGANQGDVPLPGNQYFIVALTLQNKSNRELTFDASQFALRRNDGAVVEYEDVTFQDNLLRTVVLQPNEQQSVFLVFQIPSGGAGYSLVLGDPATGGVATVQLN